MTTDAHETALRLLGVRAHSEFELTRKLQQRGYEPTAIDDTIARLRQRGYLDDAAYAESLVRLRAGRRSRAALIAELGAKGIERELAERATAAMDRDDELDTARRLAATWPTLGPERVAGRLARRGFSSDVVYAILDERRSEL